MTSPHLHIAGIAGALAEQSQRHPLRAAIREEVKGQGGHAQFVDTSYRELSREVTELASGLRAQGLGDGARVVLMAPPSKHFFALTFALFRAGAIPVFIDPTMRKQALIECLARVKADAFIGSMAAHVARWLFAARATRGAQPILVRDRAHPFMMTLANLRGREVVLPTSVADDTAAILFTSGSTGVPKGAVYSHGNFLAQVSALRSMYGIEEGEADFCTFPLFALFSAALGTTAILPAIDFRKPGAADPGAIAKTLRTLECQSLFGSPALITRLAEYAGKEGMKFPSLRRVLCAGAPVATRIVEKMTAALSVDVEMHTPYGATEALPVASIGSAEILRETAAKTRSGRGICVGRVAPGVHVRIMTTLDTPEPRWTGSLQAIPGTVGEIVVTGPQVTRRYLDHPEADRAHKIEDPADKSFWHRMGDLGYLDDHGRLWYLGRKSHRVTTPQRVLYPESCEGILNAHPRVKRTALVGWRREERTEPVVFVEPLTHLKSKERQQMERELKTLAETSPETADVKTFRFVSTMPVDRRHNAKIHREALQRTLTP